MSGSELKCRSSRFVFFLRRFAASHVFGEVRSSEGSDLLRSVALADFF